ncbi:MAG: integral membrane protein MviN [Candidatus Xenolissoclinum pacificiensis L6]|uniref:Probable lipid II flippase MurJ n=1 Tax=Candidatus Xenolissoclinum pacificiensis L6 TaxID=1401685 RepID=W2V1I8_9RICK|nr:MAG: integral membrane protein MviN [Candidatus Xenolissoclinum pacificiensis L6]
MSFLKYVSSYSIGIIISRILGFIRDLLFARTIGTGLIADIFFISFRLPNVFRSIFAEGAFSSAFLPIYSSSKYKKTFANNTYSLLILFMLGLCIIAEIFMPSILQFIAPNFLGNYDTITLVARIMFPYIFFLSITSLFTAILQANKHFAIISLTYTILNICLIISLVICYIFPSSNHLIYLACTVIIAGFLQLLWVGYLCKHLVFEVFFVKPRISQEIHTLYTRILPSILSASVYQVNVLVDTVFITSYAGATSFFYYADRFNQLPIALIGISISTVLMPLISDKSKGYISSSLNKAFAFAILLIIPTTIGLYMIAENVIRVFLVNNKFSINDAYHTALILKILCLSLPAVILNKIMLSVYFSYGNTKTPLYCSIIAMLTNVCLDIALIHKYHYTGIAIATIISVWINFLLLLFKLHKKYNVLQVNDLLIRTITAVLISSIGLIITLQLLMIYIPQPGYLGILSIVAISVLVYFTMASCILHKYIPSLM